MLARLTLARYDCVMELNVDHHPFANFATKLTETANTKVALTHLAQTHHIRCNLVLYLIWCSLNQHGRLLKQDMKRLMVDTQAWHERITTTLQRLSQQLGDDGRPRTTAIQAMVEGELSLAQQIERCLLADTLLRFNYRHRNPTQQLNDACYNITHYFRLLQLSVTEQDQQAIHTLLSAAFPQLIAAEINSVCNQSLNQANTKHYDQLQLNEI